MLTLTRKFSEPMAPPPMTPDFPSDERENLLAGEPKLPFEPAEYVGDGGRLPSTFTFVNLELDAQCTFAVAERVDSPAPPSRLRSAVCRSVD